MNPNLAVYCQSLTKEYTSGASKISALRGVDFEVRSGELMILAGPSGCGKTTLISVIAAILEPTAGECIIYGHNLNHMNESEKLAFRSKNIGFVFQQFNLMPTLTAAENVAIPLLINGIELSEATNRATELLEKMDLGDRATTMPTQLSGGQQQRVAIARAIIHGPKLIVCDEPTSALDGETGHKVMTLIKNIAADQNRALIVVTHDVRTFRFGDRISNMNDGKITQIVTPSQEV